MKIGMSAIVSGLILASVCEAENIGDPFGVCAHLNRWEYSRMPEELELMRQAGIRNVRSDLDWKQVEPQKGKWDFRRWDSLFAEAERKNITVLPILPGAQPQWGTPLVRHPEEWDRYLKTVLQRYPGQKYWEIVNEPDLNEFSNPEAYGAFLQKTYRRIKQLRPDAVVLTGGFGNIPIPYLRRMLKAGGAGSFDVMNVHPYYWKDSPEGSLACELRELRRLMRESGDGGKEIWMTETGYATAERMDMRKITAAVLEKLGLNRDSIPVVLIADNDYLYYSEGFNLDRSKFFSANRKFREITLKGLASLDPRSCPLVVLAPNEGFPMVYHKDLLNYVKAGGTVFVPGGGIPLYYDYQKKGDAVVRVPASEGIQRAFHIGWDAWWVRPGTPKSTRSQKVADGFAHDLRFPGSVSRFLSDRNLKPGDVLIPVVTAYSKDRSYSASVAGIYKFNSDLKGNIVVFAWSEYADSVSKEMQAKLLPRTYLIALSEGVRKVFWYSFRSMGTYADSRESHFGILERDLNRKPAYVAYRTLTGLLPSGSSRPEWKKNAFIYSASWNRPDGAKVYALWRVRGKSEVKPRIRGTVREIRDYLGNPVKLNNGTLTVSDGITYLIGNRDLSVELP